MISKDMSKLIPDMDELKEKIVPNADDLKDNLIPDMDELKSKISDGLSNISEWEFEDGNYFIQHAGSGKAVDMGACEPHGVHLWDFSKTNTNQLLKITRTTGGKYRITHATRNEILSVNGDGKKECDQIILEESPNEKQEWYITKVEGGTDTYQIQNAMSGYMLDLYCNKTQNGATFVQYKNNGTPAQIFKIIKA